MHVRLALPEGTHAYAEPVSSAFQAFSVELEPFDNLEIDELALPAGQPFTVAGLDEQFMVYAGAVEATLSFVVTRNLGATTLEVRVRYQACTDRVCFSPATAFTRITLGGMDLIRD